jgi:muramoyltetrapeptide carboxypeptidase LdcA involved in peptidoglycan recycling
LEILDWTMQVGTYISAADHYRGCILFIETSDEIPGATYVYRTLRSMGERGILSAMSAVMVARPTAEAIGSVADDAEVARHVDAQRAAVLRALDEYNPGVPTVLGIEAGHTDPQVIVPIGGTATLRPELGTVTFHY